MSINSKLNLKVVVPIAVIGVLGVGYFAMTSYASSKAEQQLADFMYEHQLDGAISWQSVSSSPLGGKITLHQLRIENNDVLPVELTAQRAIIKDYQQTNSINSMNVQLEQVAPIDDNNEFGEFYHHDLLGAVSALSEQGKVAPYDLNVYWRYNKDNRQAQLGFALDIPNAGKGSMHAEFNEVADLTHLYGMSYLHPSLRMLSNLPIKSNVSRRELERVELASLAISYEDQGYLSRSNTLEQRYNTKLSPLKGDANQQRQQQAAAEYQAQLTECEADIAPVYKQAKQACQAMVGTWYGQEKGMRFSLQPNQPLRLSELNRLERGERAAKALIERANPSFSTL